MTVQEWLHNKNYDDKKQAEYDIFIQFALKSIPMNAVEEAMLVKYIDVGKKRQETVLSMLSKNLNAPVELIKQEVDDFMRMEPYAVFYKTQIMKTPTDFMSIKACVAKIKEIIATRPSEEEFLFDRQRGNFQQRMPYYGLEPFIVAVRNEKGSDVSKSLKCLTSLF